MSEELRATLSSLRELLAKASVTNLIADTHHTKDYAGRTHGFLRNAGELVPVGAFVLSVEGMPQEQGRARLQLAAAAVNALPALIDHLEADGGWATVNAFDAAAVQCQAIATETTFAATVSDQYREGFKKCAEFCSAVLRERARQSCGDIPLSALPVLGVGR